MSEHGNNAAIREALEFAEDELWALGAFDSSKRVAAALAKPPRNCDVGTAEEQSRRFDAFCAAHHFQSDKGCSNCLCHGADRCEFKWGQLPYE